jgi:tRNA(Ile)-lysidine synthase
MRYDRDRYLVRPLLDLSRDDLRAAIFDLAAQGRAVAAAFDTEGIAAAGGFADQNSVPAYWREDATNADTDRFRAYVRHEIVPVARKWNASLATTLTRTMNLIADEDDMLDEFADEEIWEHAMPIDTLDKRSCDAAATGSKADVSIFEDSCRMRQVEDVFVDGCVLAPEFGEVRRPIARRAVIKLLHAMLGAEARIEAASVAGVLNAYDAHTHLPQGGYVVNIQGNLAVSANKLGVRIEPMAAFRARRKRR